MPVTWTDQYVARLLLWRAYVVVLEGFFDEVPPPPLFSSDEEGEPSLLGEESTDSDD